MVLPLLLIDDVEQLKQDVQTLATSMSQNSHDIDTLETTTTDHESRIDTLETANTDHESRIDTLETDNTSNKSRLTSLETDNTTNKSNISTLQTNKQDKIKDITDTEILAEETKTINENTILITTTKGDFKGFKSRIGSLESKTSIIEEDSLLELLIGKQRTKKRSDVSQSVR